MALLPGVVEAFRFEVEVSGQYTTLRRSKRLAVVAEKWRDVKQLHKFVWLVEEIGATTEQPRKCVFKRIFKSPGATAERMDGSREAEIMGILSHQAYEDLFVTFYGWGESPSLFHICMEYMPNGSLEDCIPSDRNLPDNEASCIIRQVLEGLNVIHGLDLIHQDIKLQNILVKSPSPRWWVKIADFGFSRREITTTASIRGYTPGYDAPELHDDSELPPVTKSVDIWSLGCLTHKLLIGCLPFPAGTNTLRAFYRAKRGFDIDRLISESNVSASAAAFLQSLLVATPSLRPTASHAISLPWIQDYLDFPSKQTHNHYTIGEPLPGFAMPSLSPRNGNSRATTLNLDRQAPVVTVSPSAVKPNSVLPPAMKAKFVPPPLPPQKPALPLYGRQSDASPNNSKPESSIKGMSAPERVARSRVPTSTYSYLPVSVSTIPTLLNKQLPPTNPLGLFNADRGRNFESLLPNGESSDQMNSMCKLKGPSKGSSSTTYQSSGDEGQPKQDARITGSQHDTSSLAPKAINTNEDTFMVAVLDELFGLNLIDKAVLSKFAEYRAETPQDLLSEGLADPEMQKILGDTRQTVEDLVHRLSKPISGMHDWRAGEKEAALWEARWEALRSKDLMDAIEEQRDYDLNEARHQIYYHLGVRYIARRLFQADQKRREEGNPDRGGNKSLKQKIQVVGAQDKVSNYRAEAGTTTAKSQMEYTSSELSALISQFDDNEAIIRQFHEYRTALPFGWCPVGMADMEMEKIFSDSRSARRSLYRRQDDYKFPERNSTMHRKREEEQAICRLVTAIEIQGDYELEKCCSREMDLYKIGVLYIARKACQTHRQAELYLSQGVILNKLSTAQVEVRQKLVEVEKLADQGCTFDKELAVKLRTVLKMITLRLERHTRREGDTKQF